MIISSNSLGKSNYIGSNILLRTDGFRKIVKGLNSKKKLLPNEAIKSNSNIHTSAGLRRVSKEYNIGNESREDGLNDEEMVKERKIMTAEKYSGTDYISKRVFEKNEVRAN